jgi:transcriptional/translational regulatory protein YebC/TACO1
VTTDVPSFHAVQDGLKQAGIEIESAELDKLPKVTVNVTGDDVAKLMKLLDVLEELDDVQKVYSNLEIDESAMTQVDA